MISLYGWIHDFRRRVERTGDRARLDLMDFYTRAAKLDAEQNEERLALYQGGRDLAARLGEPWWEMFYLYWEINTRLWSKQDARGALDLAVRATLEVAKPLYDGFPRRVSLYLDLAVAYKEIDPIAYQAQIRAAFDYIWECEHFANFQAYARQQWAAFLDAVDDPDAVRAAWHAWRLADQSDSDHYRANALILLCRVLHQRDAPTARALLSELARDAETVARARNRDRLVAIALMWQAVAARRNDDEAAAASFYARAWAIQNRLQTPHNAVNTGAIAFHETGGEWAEALRVCQRAIRVERAQHRDFQESKRRLRKCELLQQSGRSH